MGGSMRGGIGKGLCAAVMLATAVAAGPARAFDPATEAERGARVGLYLTVPFGGSGAAAEPALGLALHAPAPAGSTDAVGWRRGPAVDLRFTNGGLRSLSLGGVPVAEQTIVLRADGSEEAAFTLQPVHVVVGALVVGGIGWAISEAEKDDEVKSGSAGSGAAGGSGPD